MTASTGWDIKPGDWAEMKCVRRGTVLAACHFCGMLVGVEVGFDWFDINEVAVWKPLG